MVSVSNVTSECLSFVVDFLGQPTTTDELFLLFRYLGFLFETTSASVGFDGYVQVKSWYSVELQKTGTPKLNRLKENVPDPYVCGAI